MTKETTGADFMLGDIGLKPKKSVKISTSGDLDIDAAVALMDSKKDGEALRGGLDRAVSALDALRKTGLTGECLVVLVAEKCAALRTPGGRNVRPSHDQVRGVLEALFRLGEYVR